MAADSAGNVYVADFGNALVRKIGSDGIVSTIAGKARERGTIDGSPTDARFVAPSRLAFAPNGELYVLDNGVRLRKIATNGIVSSITLIGSVGSPIVHEDDPRLTFTGSPVFNRGGIAVDRSGRIFIAWPEDNTIKVALPA